DKAPAAPIDAYGTPGARPRDPQDYIEPAEQEFVAWPVLPESQEEEEAAAGSGRGGLFLRIGLIVGLFGVVSFWAYYFLGDYIAKRRAAQEPPTVVPTDSPASAENGDKSTTQAPETQSSPTAQDNPPPGGEQQSAGPPPQGTTKAKEISPPPVRNEVVKPPGPSNTRKPTRDGAQNGGNLTVQVGSFKDQGEADARAASLNAATGGEFHVRQANIPG